MGGCSVASCKNRFIRGTKHFFRFPKDWRRELWMKFTQRGSHFIPKSSSTICEDHFASESCQKKKNRVIMSKDAVPTIMVRDSQQYEIRFDAERRDYFDEDFLSLKLATSQPTETEESVLDQRQSRLDELKTVCRFCISNDGSKVPIAKLATYFITADTITTILGIESPSDDVFSEFLCEQCFTQIVEFDGFRKKVRDAHQEVATEILEFDEKLAEIRNGKVFEVVPIPMMDSTIEFLEEHLLDDDEFMDNEEIEYIEEIAEDISDVADESVKHKELIEQSAQGVDEYDQVTTDDIIKNPDRNRFCFKIYECFFCKMVSFKSNLPLISEYFHIFFRNSLVEKHTSPTSAQSLKLDARNATRLSVNFKPTIHTSLKSTTRFRFRNIAVPSAKPSSFPH